MSQQPSSGIPLTTYPTARSHRSQQDGTTPPFPQITAQRSSFTVTGKSSPEEEEDEAKPYKPGGKRRIKKTNSKGDQDGDNEGAKGARLNAMGRLYQKLYHLSRATRYALYIVPLALFFMMLIIIGATAASDAKIGGVRMVWFFTWFEAVWLTLFGMKFFAVSLPYAFSFFAGVVSPGTKSYARILANLEKPILAFGWVLINFILFQILFSTASAGNTPNHWTTYAKKILAALLVTVVVLLVEKIFIQFVSVSYHAHSYNNKIEESKHNIHLLGLLFEASRNLFPMYGPEFIEEDYIIHNNIEAFLRRETVNNKARGTFIRGSGRALAGVEKLSNTVGTVFGSAAAEITGKKIVDPNAPESIVLEALQKTRAAKALAQRLWFSFVVEGNDALYLSDLEEVLGPQAKDQAEEIFTMLDIDGNGDVSLDEMVMRVVEISATRKAIVRSMRDVGQAIRSLDTVLVAVCLLVAVFVLVCFLDTGFSSILSTASSTLISLSFIFSTTASEFFASCIFLFVKHPYDIDDRVDIWGPDGTMNRLLVNEISLFYSDFKRVDNMEWVQIPNNILNTLWINNITRSKAMMEQIDINISFDTSLEDLEALRQEMENFVRAPENRRDFQPDIVLQCNAVGGMDKLQLRLEVRHKSNWAVESVRVARHSKLMCALVLALRKVPIFGPGGGGPALGDPANPTYSVAVSDEEAARAREKAARDADSARLHPLNPVSDEKQAEQTPTMGTATQSATRQDSESTLDTGALAPSSELAAVEKLNTPALGRDLIRDEDDDVVAAGGHHIGARLDKVKSGSSKHSTSGLTTGWSLSHTGSNDVFGRRKAGRTASLSSGRVESISQGQGVEPERLSVPDQVVSGNVGRFDEEAQIHR